MTYERLNPAQDTDAEIDANEVVKIPKQVAEQMVEEALNAVFEHGPKIQLDHYLVYYARSCSQISGLELFLIFSDYEYGRLLGCQGKADAARHEFELILSGKPLEVGATGRKTRYSLEVCSH